MFVLRHCNFPFASVIITTTTKCRLPIQLVIRCSTGSKGPFCFLFFFFFFRVTNSVRVWPSYLLYSFPVVFSHQRNKPDNVYNQKTHTSFLQKHFILACCFIAFICFVVVLFSTGLSLSSLCSNKILSTFTLTWRYILVMTSLQLEQSSMN